MLKLLVVLVQWLRTEGKRVTIALHEYAVQLIIV